MRLFMLATAAVIALTIPAMAREPLVTPTFSAPPTEAFLRDLDTEQLRIVRNTSRGCSNIATAPARTIKAERDPCVIAGVDKAVADTGNPDLQAFHQALPDSDRYDEHRPTTVWRDWVVKS